MIAKRRDYITDEAFRPLYDENEVLVKMITAWEIRYKPILAIIY